MACAAGLATLDIYEREGLFERAASLAPWEKAVHTLRASPHVTDIRNLGLVAGIELEPRPNEPGKRAYEVLLDCFENGVLVRQAGDIIALSPPLIVEDEEFHQIVDSLSAALQPRALIRRVLRTPSSAKRTPHPEPSPAREEGAGRASCNSVPSPLAGEGQDEGALPAPCKAWICN